MNIFFLSCLPREAAQLQCNKHVVKMILEMAQLLSTAYWTLVPEHLHIPVLLAKHLYRTTHLNHPMAKWVRHSRANFEWTLQHGLALCQEYTKRYKKTHKTQETLMQLQCYWKGHIGPQFEHTALTLPPQCMPDSYKTPEPKTLNDVVDAYWRYYAEDKRGFAKWPKDATPVRWQIELDKLNQ